MILIDANNVGFRALYKLINLSYEEKPTGVIFGFLRSMQKLASEFNDRNLVFCWDSKTSIRKEVYPGYKNSRSPENLTEDLLYNRKIGYYQFDILREEILPKLGFKNNFSQEGIEADDIIARITIDWAGKGKRIQKLIISSDTDLYQLLPYVDGIYSPGKKQIITESSFTEQYGVSPHQWPTVKAITGDSSDNIIGIKGIGVKTACKFILGRPVGKSGKIIETNWEMVKENEKLIRLPYPLTKSEIVQFFPFRFDWAYFDYMCQQYYLQFFQKKENYQKWRETFGD